MKYDIAIIGGGPAGMMSAIIATQAGKSVVLIEKNSQPGMKLLSTGGSRCNLTNNISDIKDLIANYGTNGKFLFSAFSKFGVDFVQEFFESRGVALKIEENNRVFPKSDRSIDVLNCLIKELQNQNVFILVDAPVSAIKAKDNVIEKIILADKTEIEADNYIFAFGGRSYPSTGSNGDAYPICRRLGHNVIAPRPGLSPLILNDKHLSDIEGISLQDIAVIALKDNHKFASTTGDIIFTSRGISGPSALNISNSVSTITKENFAIQLDFFPKLTPDDLDKAILKIFTENNNRTLKNCASKLLPLKLWQYCLAKSSLNVEKKVNLVTAEERSRIVKVLKDCRFGLKGVAWFNEAMITLGGIDLSEVNPKTMKSKIITNLYFAGEILDLAGPTGGFNLQMCWSTGALAGESASS